MPVTGLKTRSLTKPQSMTKRMPSMVTDASAMLVEMTTFRVREGVGSKIAICCSDVRPACSGIGIIAEALRGKLQRPNQYLIPQMMISAYLGIRSASRSMHVSISSLPVKNSSMSPGG